MIPEVSKREPRLSKETESLMASYRLLAAEQSEKLSKKASQLDLITRYLHTLLNHISQGILFIDLNGIITTYNGAAELLLEKDPLDLLFAKYESHFSDIYFGFSMQKALETKIAPESLSVNIETPSGKIKELEIQTSFVLDEKEEPLGDSIETIQGLTLVLRDTTEINRLRKLAYRNDRMKELGEIAASVAHEIRNPLGGIKGFASLLQRDLKENPKLQKMAANINEGAEILERLVTSILNYSRPLSLKTENIDLSALLEDLVRGIKVQYLEKPEYSFSIKTDGNRALVNLDKQLFKNALLNLTLNAIQAMPEGGTIVFEVVEEPFQTLLKIVDQGVGILPENLDKIFSPFFTTKPSGNGFGLTEAHKIIVAHEGTIEAFSEINKGTTFVIKLPNKLGARKKW